jgi:hypothetical protein
MEKAGDAYVYVRNIRESIKPAGQPNIEMWVVRKSYTAKVILNTNEIRKITECLSEEEIRREIEEIIPNPTYYFYSVWMRQDFQCQ